MHVELLGDLLDRQPIMGGGHQLKGSKASGKCLGADGTG